MALGFVFGENWERGRVREMSEQGEDGEQRVASRQLLSSQGEA